MVHGAGRVDLGLELARDVGQLGAGQDVEVVVGGVAAGVAFGADGGAEDDEVFGYAWVENQYVKYLVSILRRLFLQLTSVNNVHGTHGAAGVVEDPFLVEVHVGLG